MLKNDSKIIYKISSLSCNSKCMISDGGFGSTLESLGYNVNVIFFNYKLIFYFILRSMNYGVVVLL